MQTDCVDELCIALHEVVACSPSITRFHPTYGCTVLPHLKNVPRTGKRLAMLFNQQRLVKRLQSYTAKSNGANITISQFETLVLLMTDVLHTVCDRTLLL